MLHVHIVHYSCSTRLVRKDHSIVSIPSREKDHSRPGRTAPTQWPRAVLAAAARACSLRTSATLELLDADHVVGQQSSSELSSFAHRSSGDSITLSGSFSAASPVPQVRAARACLQVLLIHLGLGRYFTPCALVRRSFPSRSLPLQHWCHPRPLHTACLTGAATLIHAA